MLWAREGRAADAPIHLQHKVSQEVSPEVLQVVQGRLGGGRFV